MSFIIHEPEQYVGRVIANGHCVRFLQEAGRLPHTSQWRRGARVKNLSLARGTCIATFDADGLYANDTAGASHAAVFLDQVSDGLVVYDCWVDQPVAQRTIRFKGGRDKPVNDGDQYHVIEVAAPERF
ncbi:MAG TPA: BPSL0067 family protein [Mycobacterium sp.]|jgi:hypothetical protein